MVLIDDNLPALPPLGAGPGVARELRIAAPDGRLDGPKALRLDDPGRGAGLRPLSPVHLHARRGDGGIALDWVRRTRIGGDGWDAPDVPLGEERELYALRLVDGAGRAVLEALPTEARWSGAAPGAVAAEVAQISALWGAGPAARVALP